MSEPWTFILAGTGFCLSGIFLFQRNAFEENRKVSLPLLIIILGVMLLTIGLGKRMGLIP